MKGVISGLLIFKILPSDTRFDTLSLQLSNRTYSPLSGSVTWTGLDSTTDLIQSFSSVQFHVLMEHALGDFVGSYG